MARPNLAPGFASLRIPAVILHGQNDQLIRPDGARATAGASPDAELVFLPGMGHDLPKALWPSVIHASGRSPTAPGVARRS